MKAHKVVEALQGLQATGQVDAQVAELLIEKIAQSQKFLFDFGEFPTISEAEMEDAIEQLRLPYPLCYFEISTIGALLARETGDAVILQGFLQTPSGIGITPVDFLTVTDKHTKSISYYAVGKGGEEAINAWNAEDNPYAFVYLSIISLLIRGLTVLNCSNVHCIDNPPPAQLNKKRLKNGRLPIYSFKTLHIRTSKTGGRTESLADGSYDRNGPRLHLRRGHIRKLPSGVRTWVQSCMVGSANDGMAFKEYTVT